MNTFFTFYQLMLTILTEMEIGEGETTLDLILVGVTGAGGLTLGLMQGGVEMVAMTTLDMDIRVDWSKENFPKSILTMVFGCQNASG